MWFKNIRAYRLTQPFNLSPEQLGEQLAARGFAPCAKSQAVAAGWVYTAILFEAQPVLGWVWLAVLVWLTLAAWAAITFLASTATGSVAAAAGLGFVGLLVLSVVAAIPSIARFTPAGLTAPGLALAGGASPAELGADLWVPLLATAALIVGAIGLSLVAFRRREL